MLPVRLILMVILSSGSALAWADNFRIVDDSAEGVIRIFDGDKPVLAYRYADQLAKGVPADRTRSSYIHPIHGLNGEVLTDDFPKDHTHHRGLSWMWPRMKVGEKPVELWHIKGIRDYFDKWIERSIDEQGAVLTVANLWKLDDGRKVADERVRLRVHPATKLGRAIDVEIEITALGEPVVVQGQVDKGYGGLNLRFAPRKDTMLTTDSGPHPKDSDKKPFKWVDLSARFAGRSRMSGIAVLAHPDHPGFPPPWTLRHYGDLNAAWPGLQPFTLERGKPLRLKYRLWIHRGDAAVGRVAKAWRTYVGD